MCLIAFAWRAHASLPLVVAANRDEWRARPTEPAHAWEGLFAGRDRLAGGTWLGFTAAGRFAALTNVREPSVPSPGAPSRGALVSGFLHDTRAPRAFLEALDAAPYASFNLLVGDLDELYYFGSPRREIVRVPPGVHALSNHRLNEPWPKVERSKAALAALLGHGEPSAQALCDIMSDTRAAADDQLPDTGVGLELERKLAPILLTGGAYGTRCTSVLLARDDRSIEFHEYTRDQHGNVDAHVELRSG